MQNRTGASAPAPLLVQPLAAKTFGPILAVHFLGTLGFSLAIPFLVYIVDDLGGASWTYGLVAATYSAFQLVGAPALGKWSDRIGRRKVLIVSQVGTFFAWVLFLVALSMPKSPLVEIAGASLTVPLLVIFLARALDGATGGNISVANAYVADLTDGHPQLQSKAFGQMGVASSLGFVLGPAAAGMLGGTSLGASLPVGLAALLAAATTVAIFLALKDPKKVDVTPLADVSAVGGAPAMSAANAPRGVENADKDRSASDEADVSAWRPPVLPLVIATFVLFVAFNLFYAGFPTHANEAFGWEVGKLGTFFAILSVASVLTQGPLLSVVAGRVSRRVLFGGGMGLLLLSFVLMQLPLGLVTYVGAVTFALGNGLSWPTFLARVAEVGGHSQGAVQGAVTGATSAASILGLVAGGLLYPLLHGQLFLVGAALFGVIGALTPLWFPNPNAAGADRTKVEN